MRDNIFLSTPSARRATGWPCRALRPCSDFYPRPPRGGRLAAGACLDSDLRFLSTPSARRATHIGFIAGIYDGISIHALREEGDFFQPSQLGVQVKFLSTPSARRATGNNRYVIYSSKISIHALREEGDNTTATQKHRESYFYPRPPRGGRPSTV